LGYLYAAGRVLPVQEGQPAHASFVDDVYEYVAASARQQPRTDVLDDLLGRRPAFEFQDVLPVEKVDDHHHPARIGRCQHAGEAAEVGLPEGTVGLVGRAFVVVVDIR